MKIAITVNTSWNIYNFRMGLINKLLSDGHQVIAVAPEDDYSKKLETNGCKFRRIRMDNTGSNPLKDYSLYRQLKKIYSEEKPDAIFHYTVKPNIYGTLAATQLEIPVINNVSGLGTVFLTKSIASFVAKKLYQIAFAKADRVFFQNPDDRAAFLSEINIPKLKTDLLPGSGINLSDFTSAPLKKDNRRTFLMIARLIVDKGVVEYVEAAKMTLAKHPDSKFQLLGKMDPEHARGISEHAIKDAVDNGTIEYLGETHDVKPFIRAASCIVLPSYREGTPRTLLEAAAMMRPVITSDVPGCREVVVENESGLLCQVKNASDLSNKMIDICEMSYDQLENMGKKGRQLIQRKFDEKIVIDQYLNHLSNIMNQISNE